MRKIIGASLIVLSLAGCAGGGIGNLGDSAWSRDYWRTVDSQPKGG
jgi:hypothetical protein